MACIRRAMSADKGSVLYSTIHLAGQRCDLRDGASLAVMCDRPAEVDRCRDCLLADRGEPAQCGWLVVRFGRRWQVAPRRTDDLIQSAGTDQASTVTHCLFDTGNIDVPALEAAYDAL